MTSKAPFPVPANWTAEPGAATPGTGTAAGWATPTAGWAILFRPDKLNITEV